MQQFVLIAVTFALFQEMVSWNRILNELNTVYLTRRRALKNITLC